MADKIDKFAEYVNTPSGKTISAIVGRFPGCNARELISKAGNRGWAITEIPEHGPNGLRMRIKAEWIWEGEHPGSDEFDGGGLTR